MLEDSNCWRFPPDGPRRFPTVGPNPLDFKRISQEFFQINQTPHLGQTRVLKVKRCVPTITISTRLATATRSTTATRSDSDSDSDDGPALAKILWI